VLRSHSIQASNHYLRISSKAARTYNASLADNIRKFVSFSDSAKNSAVIYAGKENGKINNVNFVNFKNTESVL
jgi:hypothetical protein